MSSLKEVKLLAEQMFNLQIKMLRMVQLLEFNDAIEFKIWYQAHPALREIQKLDDSQ